MASVQSERNEHMGGRPDGRKIHPTIGSRRTGRVASSRRNQIDRYGFPVARAMPISQVRLLE